MSEGSAPYAFILASASPRRQELLGSLGLRFQIVPSCIDESLFADEPFVVAVERLAREKALAVAQENPAQYVLAADTLVIDGQTILAKPSDELDAFEMLQRLQGKSHIVATGCALVCLQKNVEEVFHVQTKVQFKRCSEAEIRAYCATGEPLDKAGGYGIQGLGAFLVQSIEGSYTNVVGLPLAEVADHLMRLGVWRAERLGTSALQRLEFQ